MHIQAINNTKFGKVYVSNSVTSKKKLMENLINCGINDKYDDRDYFISEYKYADEICPQANAFRVEICNKNGDMIKQRVYNPEEFTSKFHYPPHFFEKQ